MEKEDLIKKYAEFFNGLCSVLNINPQDEHLKDTPKRIVQLMLELCEGYFENPDLHVCKTFKTLPDAQNEQNSDMHSICSVNTITTENGILIVHNGIPFSSLCCHHLLPFFGYAYVGILVKEKVIGLSKVARVVNTYSKRLQIQENFTQEVTNTLSKIEGCEGVIVITDAIHGCMSFRGVRTSSVTTCSALTGIFLSEPTIKHEFLSLLMRRDLSIK